MSKLNNIPLLGETHEDSEWIPEASKKWIPSVKKPRKWGTNLPQPRKQWQDHIKGGKK